MSTTTCIGASGEIIHQCQSNPSIALPRIIRHDINAYIEQRQAGQVDEPISALDLIKEIGIHENDDKNINIESTTKNINNHNTCRLYMAPSSIPNSGLGIFAGVDIPSKSFADLNPQCVIPLLDIQDHTPLYDNSILSNYPWIGASKGVHLEANSTALLYPNLGMLANSHLGLANVQQEDIMRPRFDMLANRTLNPGVGAMTSYDGFSFVTDTDLVVGDELFVDYGEGYFHGREKVWDTFFPTAANYEKADEILRNFIDSLGEELEDEQQQMWDKIISALENQAYDLKDDDDDGDYHEEEEEEKDDAGDLSQKRIAHALPKSIKDLPRVAEIGTARNSVPNSNRPLEYLQTHGICLDNLRVGKSSISQAGNGAFATNYIKSDSTIVPAPLVPIHRHLLNMSFLDLDLNESIETNQLLLNYCFGHPSSSLLFFPYSSTVQFINHDGEKPNAYIRWSTSEMNRHEMLEKDVNDVYTGLLLEVVALRDIEIGDEVKIDYGIEWESAWNDHVESFKVPEGELEINPHSIAETLMNEENENKPFRTIEEQKENPYPACIRTACHSVEYNGSWMYAKHEFRSLRFCDVLERVRKGSSYWYKVRAFTTEEELEEEDADEDVQLKKDEHEEDGTVHEKKDYIVENVAQMAILLTEDQYCSDLHVKNAFRHEIGVPDDLYPDIWLDLNTMDKDQNDDDHEEKNDNQDQVYEQEIAHVTCDTTAGSFSISLHRNFSPNGYDRAVELFERGYYDKSHFFRVVPDFLVQFGMSYTQDNELQLFAKSPIDDDPQLNPPIKFREGTISFAGSGKNSRTSHLFIAYTAFENFGKEQWETPVGTVIRGMEVLKSLYSGYGDMPPWGNGPEQHRIINEGREYIKRGFPDLDEILTCRVRRFVDDDDDDDYGWEDVS